MAGVLFIIIVPQKDHEILLRKASLQKGNPSGIQKIQSNKKAESTEESHAQDDLSVSTSKPTTIDSETVEALYKSKSEITLNVSDYLEDGKSYAKRSWEDIKQVFQSRKNKLYITEPVRGIDILSAFHWDTPLETIIKEIISRLSIYNATWIATSNDQFWQLTFSIESGHLCEELLQVFRIFGIGSRLQSSLSVVPCTLYYQSNEESTDTFDIGKFDTESNSAWSRFSSSVRARTNLAQVLHDVKADAALTFDWLFLLVAAAFVAAIGLMENSTVVLVASMLISPLMGPITAGTLGTAMRDRTLQQMGVLHELMGLFLCLVIGFIFGLAICAVDGRYGVVDDWPTTEMMSRCEYRSLWVGILIAIPSGACVALSVLGDYTGSLVGVAISASLLPPAVNAGLLWSMSLFRLVIAKDDLNWVVDTPSQLALLGTASLCLTLINIVCIFVAGVAVYKVKEVCPLEQRDITWWRANKNRLQASKRERNDSTAAWEIYRKWSNESTDLNDFTKPGFEKVESETVTRRPLVLKRMRAKSIEECFRKAKIDDSYEPLGSESSETPEYETQSSDVHDKPTKHASENINYFNFSYENQKTKTNMPTLEPSINFTVESKRNRVFLGENNVA